MDRLVENLMGVILAAILCGFLFGKGYEYLQMISSV